MHSAGSWGPTSFWDYRWPSCCIKSAQYNTRYLLDLNVKVASSFKFILSVSFNLETRYQFRNYHWECPFPFKRVLVCKLRTNFVIENMILLVQVSTSQNIRVSGSWVSEGMILPPESHGWKKNSTHQHQLYHYENVYLICAVRRHKQWKNIHCLFKPNKKFDFSRENLSRFLNHTLYWLTPFLYQPNPSVATYTYQEQNWSGCIHLQQNQTLSNLVLKI